MNLQHITILTLFIEGLLSFFSPCVLPYSASLYWHLGWSRRGEAIWRNNLG